MTIFSRIRAWLIPQSADPADMEYMSEVDVALTLQRPDHPGLKAQALACGVLVALAPIGYWPPQEAGRPLPLMALANAPLIGLSSADPLAAQDRLPPARAKTSSGIRKHRKKNSVKKQLKIGKRA